MRRLVFAVLPLLTLLAGCGLFKNKERYYTYCDATGCYSCTVDGCQRTGGDNPWTCYRDDQCPSGQSCDRTRNLCTGGTGGGAGSGGSSCMADRDCAQGYFCHPTTKQCLQSWKCSSSADCGAGMVCDGRNTCVPGPQACNTSTDCAAGCYCANNKCEETGLCQNDTECKMFGVAYTCQSGTCAPPVVSVPCTTDASCKPGQFCINGQCKGTPTNPTGACTKDVECGPGGICTDGRCSKACTSSTQCGTGQVCATGHCQAAPAGSACVYNTDCGQSQSCINGTCHANCTSNAECSNPADVCIQGVCSANTGLVAQCKLNADCSTGQECVNASCRTHCFSNADCASCSGTPSCELGYCK